MPACAVSSIRQANKEELVMLFDNLTPEEKEKVHKTGIKRKFKDGDFVIREKDSGDSLFFVLSGEVEIRKKLDADRSKCLQTLGESKFFGEMSFFDKAARSADVVACGNCELLEIPSEEFEKLMISNPAVGAKIYKNIGMELTEKLRSNNDELKKAILWAVEGWKYPAT